MVRTTKKGNKPTNVPKTNRLPHSNASSKLGRGRPNTSSASETNRRSADTVRRLKMYASGKPIRNRKGNVILGGSFLMKDRAGDRPMDGSTGRIQPDRRWFGNTRLVSPKELDTFRHEMTQQVADPYSVVLKRKQLPMGLLQEAAELQTNNKALLEQEPFEQAFGNKSRRKRVKLDQLLESRTINDDEKQQQQQQQQQQDGGYAALLSAAQQSQDTYQQVNTQDGMVPWGRDSNLTKTTGEGVDWVHEKKDDLFLKGQSKRIWAEFFKVIDCSDVILHVIDARNVPGTRCTMIENHIAKHAKHKHLVFVLNKIDLVPNWVAKRWMGELAKDRPTVAFHSSLTHAFGKGALISLLRQFGKLHQDKKQISVGVIGYPNVGKSSVINTLISKKGCKVAPVPGETKIWQYITLFKRISLIDCPGVVVDTAGDTETDSVLKGVVRAERLETPEEFVSAIEDAVKREHIAAQYKLPKDGTDTWKNSAELMEMIAKRCGRLRKGGEPCLRSAAIMLINDFQRGRLPHYVAPPELKDDEPTATRTVDTNIVVQQDLSAIGEENMKKDDDKMDSEEDAKPRANDKNSTKTDSEEDAKPKAKDKKAPKTQDEEDANESDSASDSEEPKPVAVRLGGTDDWDD